MTILDALEADHDQAKSLLKRILEAKGAKERGAMFAEFKKMMTAHSRAEEKVLYKRLEQTEAGKDEALEGAVEHQVADRLMAELARARSKNSDPWTARCKVLKELIEHHVEEEEDEFFKTARDEFDPSTLSKMAEEFAREKRKYGVESSGQPVAAE